MTVTAENIQQKYAELASDEFIVWLTDTYLHDLGGALTADNMDQLNIQQHSLLAYRYVLEEVMEGGFIQLIINGYAPYVLEGPFPMIVKKEWGMRDFSKLLYDVKKEYHANHDRFDIDMSDEDFMALYEQLEVLNDYGDDFLDDFQEDTTPAVAAYVVEHANEFC